MKILMVVGLLILWSKGLGYADGKVHKDEPNGNNVFIITLDGYRWQELFLGADSALIHDPAFTSNPTFTKSMFWSPSIKERREKLMPFFWNVVAKRGQLFGNRTKGSLVNTKNFYYISYPGYNEIFTGKADPFVSSNKKKNNRNINLLEYLNAMPEYKGRIAAFTSWNAFPYILNEERSKVYVNSGYELFEGDNLSKTQRALNELQRTTAPDSDAERNDLMTFLAAREYITRNKPKVLYLALGGTDGAGHEKQYGDYLKEANQSDRIIGDLWDMVQSMPFYKNKTTFIITTDHGRGNSHKTWYRHTGFTNGASQTWIAMLGNGVKPMGEHFGKMQLYQKHIAGTIGYLLGVKSYKRKMIPANYFEPMVTESVPKESTAIVETIR